MSYVDFFILLYSEVDGPTERNSIVNTLSAAMTFLSSHLRATSPICVDVSHIGAFCVRHISLISNSGRIRPDIASDGASPIRIAPLRS
jgi:hypothetical protein